jgi:hypothetical protein
MIQSLPPNFPVIDAIPSHCLQRGWTLEKEMQEGNIYLQDYEMLDGVSTVMKDGVPLAVPSAMVLFYLRPSQDLVPIAIQLGQKPGYDCPIWTPGDTGWYSLQSYTQSMVIFCSAEDWLWAKMWVGSAIGQASQLYFHLPMAHFCMEVFAVALLRCLPPAHPVHKILKENFQFIILVRTSANHVVLA